MNGQTHFAPRFAPRRARARRSAASSRSPRRRRSAVDLRDRGRQGQLRLDDLVRHAVADVGRRAAASSATTTAAARRPPARWASSSTARASASRPTPTSTTCSPTTATSTTRRTSWSRPRSRATTSSRSGSATAGARSAASRGSTTRPPTTRSARRSSDDAKSIAVAQHHAARPLGGEGLRDRRPAGQGEGRQPGALLGRGHLHLRRHQHHQRRSTSRARTSRACSSRRSSGRRRSRRSTSARPTTCRVEGFWQFRWNALPLRPGGNVFLDRRRDRQRPAGGVHPELGAGRAAREPSATSARSATATIIPAGQRFTLRRPAGGRHRRARCCRPSRRRTRTSSASRRATSPTTPTPSGASTTCTTTTRSRSSASSTIRRSPPIRSGSATSCSTARAATCSACRSTATSATGRSAPRSATGRRTASASIRRCRSRVSTARSARRARIRATSTTKKWQAHLTAIYLLGPSGDLGWLLRGLNAAEGTLLLEVATAYYPNLDRSGKYPYLLPNYELPTKLSTGLVASFDVVYPHVFGSSVNLTPQIDILCDISGTSPNTIPFVEGRARRHAVAQLRVPEQVAGAARLHELLGRRRPTTCCATATTSAFNVSYSF